jgi:hypothetical protein
MTVTTTCDELSLATRSYLAADDAKVGDLELNDAISKIPAAGSKNPNMVYTAEGDSYKCVVDRVEGNRQRYTTRGRQV